MSRHPIGTRVEFTLPRPVASSKNRRRLFARGKRVMSIPSAQAVDDAAMIRTMATMYHDIEFDADDALSLTIEHRLASDSVRVVVEKIGELPARNRGTKRDAHGMIETIADALQGVLYPDDRNIDATTVRRVRS